MVVLMQKRSLYNFLMNSPKGTVLLSSFNTSEISKIAGKVFDTLDEIVERAGEENVIQVVTDNASNYKAPGDLLMEKRKALDTFCCTLH
jgi:endonuclease IV